MNPRHPQHAALSIIGLTCSASAVLLSIAALVLINRSIAGPHNPNIFPPEVWLCLVPAMILGLAGPITALLGLTLSQRKGLAITSFILSMTFSAALLLLLAICFILFYFMAFSF